MVKMTVTFPKSLITQMEQAGNLGSSSIEKILDAGAEIVEKKVASNLSAVVGKDTKYKSRSTGELEGSLGISRVLSDTSGGYNVKVGFAEPRSDGGSNAMIANVLEYGKSGQSAKPFMKPAMTSSKKECVAAMKAAFLEETGI